VEDGGMRIQKKKEKGERNGNALTQSLPKGTFPWGELSMNGEEKRTNQSKRGAADG